MERRGQDIDEQAVRRDESVPEATRRGQWWATPFVVLGSVATVVWAVAGVVAGALLLVWWLA